MIASSKFWDGWIDEDMANLKVHELNQDLKM
jgi:hypothetical protein